MDRTPQFPEYGMTRQRTGGAAFAGHRRFGFTLVEVMISIAIALVLILGISQIFSLAQQTTGAGMDLLAAVETNRAVQERLKDDFQAMANGTDSPGLVITSYSIGAFRNRADFNGNRAPAADPTQVNDLVGTGSLPAGTAITVNSRIHRVDRMVFFIRNHVFRQTADGPNLTSPTSSNEAMVWLGHVAQPDDATITGWSYAAPQNGTWYNPAENSVASNQNNSFASSWILGREVMLFVPTPTESYFPGPPSGYTSTTPSPLSLLAPAAVSLPVPSIPVFASRYDLAATSLSDFRQFLTTRGTTVSAGRKWWEELSGVRPNSATPTIAEDTRYDANAVITKPGTTVAPNWMSAAVAQTYPIFVHGCTQFIVEYAGDYLQQDPSTGAFSAGQDGQIDFIVDPTTGAHQIRWYGASRDVNGDRMVDAVHDVVPLATVLGSAQPFERAVPNAATFNGTAPYTSQVYQCAWGPDTDAAGIPRPKMIRITMAVDDPNGHLNTEQTFEYVFTLP